MTSDSLERFEPGVSWYGTGTANSARRLG